MPAPPPGPPGPAAPGRKPSVSAFVAGHKKELLIAGAAAAVLLGLRHKATGAGLGAGDPGAQTSTATGGGSFDSSSSDVYNALQPQIEQTQTMLQKLLDRLGPTTPIPTTPAIHYVQPNASPSARAKRAYLVRRGDTLSSIGAVTKTDWHKIYAINRAVIGNNPNLIRPGQRLVVP